MKCINSNYFMFVENILAHGKYKSMCKMEKDSYGNEVARLARPLPVEYLLVDVPTASPLTPKYSLSHSFLVHPFSIENRYIDGHVQDFAALANYFKQFARDAISGSLYDFHVLLYLGTNDILSLKDYMDPLLEAIRVQDNSAITRWLNTEHWESINQLLKMSSAGSFSSSVMDMDSHTDDSDTQSIRYDTASGEDWSCSHCTFKNIGRATYCEMCTLPK